MATFRRLNSGGWGLKGYANEMNVGQRVRVETRGGAVVFKTVGRFIGWEDGQRIHYEQGKEPQEVSEPPQTGGNNGHGTSGQAQQPAHNAHHGNGSQNGHTPAQQAPMALVNDLSGNAANQVVVAAVQAASVPASQSNYEPGELERPDHAVRKGPPAPTMSPEDMEAQARRMGELVMIDYDIKDHLTQIDPSPYLYAAGFYRSSFSCWVGEKSRIPWRLLHRLEEMGHTWDYTGLKADETVRKISQAIVKITEEIRSLEDSITRTVNTAQKNLEEASETNDDGTRYATLRTQERHRKTVETAIKKCQERLERFMSAARAFGIAGVVTTERQRMAGIVSGMKRVAADRVNAWLSMVDKAKDTPMAGQIESGEMPTGIALDYLTDEGIDVEDERDNL